MNAGTIKVYVNTGALGTGLVTINAGTTLLAGNGNRVCAPAGGFLFNGDFTFDFVDDWFTLGGASSAITLGADVKINVPTVSATRWSKLAGAIGETGGSRKLTKVGAGTLELTAANTFSGGITVAAGAVIVGSSSSVGSGPVFVDSGAKLTASASGNFSGNAVTIGSSALGMGLLSLTYNGAPPAGLTSASSGVLALDFAGNYTTALDLAALGDGTMYLGSTGASATTYTAATLGAGSGNTYRLGGGGGTLVLDYNTTVSTTGVLVDGGSANSLVVGRNGGGTYFSGSVTTRDNNAFTGSITVNNGSTFKALLNDLATGAVTPFGANTSGAITLNGGTLALDKNATSGGGARTVTKGALTYTGSATVSLTGDATRTVQLTAGTLTRDSTYKAGLVVVSTTTTLGGNEKFIVTTDAPARLALPDGALGKKMIAPYMVASDGNFLDYATPNGFAKSGFDYTWSAGDGSGIGANDIVTWTANVTMQNATTTMKALNCAALKTLSTGGASSKLVLVSGGLTVAFTGSSAPIDVPVQFGPDATAVEGCVYSLGTGYVTFGADVTGSGGLTKFGPGDLRFSILTRTLSGAITVTGGKLYINWSDNDPPNTERFPNISGWVLNGGTLEVAGHCYMTKPVTVGPLGGTLQNLNVNHTFYLDSNILAGSPQSGVLTLNESNTFGAGLKVRGTGNTYNGGTIVQCAGTITVEATSSLGTGPVNVLAGSTLALNGNANIASSAALTANGTAKFIGASPTIGSLAGGGSVVLGVSGGQVTTLGMGGANADTAFYGVISEAGAGKGCLTKTGTGAQTLNGANTYTGPTIVNNGKLQVNGSLAAGSEVTVAAAGTLGGSGTVGGTVALSGSVAPGAGVGTLTTGTETWTAGAQYKWEIKDSDAGAGTGWDLLRVNGDINFATPPVTPKYKIVVTSLTSTGDPGLVPDFQKGQPYTWMIATNTGTMANFNASSFEVDASAFLNNPTGTFRVQQTGKKLELAYSSGARGTLMLIR